MREYTSDDAYTIVKKINNNSAADKSILQRIRKASGMTQKKLASEAGAKLHMIQLYEQKKRDINKALAVTVLRIAHVLNYDVKDILE